MKKKRLICLSISLVLALCLQLSPVVEAATQTETGNALTADSLTTSDVATEDVSAREEQIKYFDNNDGSYTAAIYAEPIHYLDDSGQWQNINNTLSLVTPSVNESSVAVTNLAMQYYENVANNFKVRLPKKMTSNSVVQVQYSGYSMGFRMLNTTAEPQAKIANTDSSINQKDVLLEKANQAAINQDFETQEVLLKEAATLIPNQLSSLSYSGVCKYTDIHYSISGQKLKESIVLTKPTSASSFSFVFAYTGLTPVVQEHGAVYFYADGSENKDLIFVIQAPYMEDSGEEDSLCTDIDVSVTPTASGCIYSITPDAVWLQDPKRVYPITIDPTVTTSTAAVDIEDNGVNEFNPTTNYMTVDRMYVGSNVSNGTAYESRIYIRFPKASAIGTNAYITSATMTLNHHSTSSWQTADNNTLNIYEVGNHNWNTNTITWNTQANYTFSNCVASGITDKSNSSESFNITSLVRKWYGTTASNNGIVIKPKKIYTNKTNRTCYLSSDCDASYSAKRPRIKITYSYGTVISSVSTPADGGGYFLRNLRNGNYLTVYNSVDANSQNVDTETFSGGASQRWRTVKNSDGSYRLRAGVGSFSRYLNVSGSNVNLYSDNATNQTFSLVRYGSTNLFYIKYGSKYVSQDTDGNVYVCSYSIGAASLWSFESVFGIVAPLYPAMLSNAVPSKYKASKYEDMDDGTLAMNVIRTSRVFISNCHGNIECIDAGNEACVTRSMMQNLPANDLKGIKVAVYIACETGLGGETAPNFVNATYDKGAQAVIGFKESIGAIGDAWGNGFMASLCAGDTIQQAMEAGDELGRDVWHSYENIRNRTERGNLNVTVLE